MPSLTTVVLINGLVVAGLMSTLWIVSLARRDASIVDPFWGTGFVAIAWSTWIQSSAAGPRGWLLLGMATLWGLRLTFYLLWRNAGKDEDRRYQAMRSKHGSRFWWVSLITVFGLQGLIMWIVSLPLQAGILTTEGRLGLLDGLGTAIWLVGFYFESVGDYQLARFKAQPENEGQVLSHGVWRYTRHPNYFGDFCIWWGHYLVAAAGGAWWTVFSPLLMSVLLLKVSGVTLLERDIAERRPEYEAYRRRTNAFFPGPPRRG